MTKIVGLVLYASISFNVFADQDNDWRIPPGQLVDVGGYKLHIYCIGEGSPAVILDSGMGGFSMDWYVIEQSLATKSRVCAYDRAGYGWSEPGPPPRTTDQIVEELHLLLEHASIMPPYLLVGHSFGGYNMQYFAKLFPKEVAGLVLVDSSHPEQAERLPELPSVREKSRSARIVSVYVGQSTLKYYPDIIRSMVMRQLSQRKFNITHQRESVNFAISGEQVSRAGPLPPVPLIVISRGQRVWPEDPYGDMLESVWKIMQAELVTLSPQSRQIIARGSKHLIHLEQPELVSAAIDSMLEELHQHPQQESGDMACLPGDKALVDC